MPPSVNALYATNKWKSGPGRMKTADYREYETEMQAWAFKNNLLVQYARNVIAIQLKKNRAIHINRIYYFPKERVLTKAGVPKRNDTSNRIKALDDSLAHWLHFDDCMLWNGAYEKRILTPTQLPEAYVNVELTFIDIVQV